MKSTRRSVILGAAAASGALLVPGRSSAQDEPNIEASEMLLDSIPALPEEWRAFEGSADVSALDLAPEPLGTQQPTSAEVAMAARILSASPHGTRRPLDVARFFQEVGQGALNERFGGNVAHYVRGWPVRYNPVIINFFKATRTNPLALNGDYTAWCAAFLNWCVARSLSDAANIPLDARGLMEPFPASILQRGTRSASSGSFRCWLRETGESDRQPRPVPGDVIVWAVRGSVNGCEQGKGHVGFYTGRAPDGRYRTLGGNQTDPSTGRSAVVEKLMPAIFARSDGRCEFHSIRKVDLA